MCVCGGGCLHAINGKMEMGSEELLALRAKHKCALRELLQQFEGSEEVRLYKASVGLEHFKLQQVEERHRAEVVALLCYQFSIMGNQLHNTVFVAGVEDVLPRFQVMVDHGIETGLCTVCLDKRTGRVVGFLSQNDILDPPPFFDTSLQTIKRGEWGVYQRMSTSPFAAPVTTSCCSSCLPSALSDHLNLRQLTSVREVHESVCDKTDASDGLCLRRLRSRRMGAPHKA